MATNTANGQRLMSVREFQVIGPATDKGAVTARGPVVAWNDD